MLEFIEKMNFDEDSIFILIQATSPFTRPEDIDKAIKKISKGASVLSVCNFNRFIWDKNGPINYDFLNEIENKIKMDNILKNRGFLY